MSTGTRSAFNTPINNGEGLPPAGTHTAVLIGLIDLGTHSTEFNGEVKKLPKILLCWELTSEHDTSGKTFVVQRDFTWSLGKKAKLRPIIEGMIGKALTSDDFDLALLMNKPCLVTLVEGTSKNDRKFIEVKSASQPMRNQTVPPATRTTYAMALSMVDPTQPDFDIPEWVPLLYGKPVIDKIRESEEYLGFNKTHGVANNDIPF